MTKRSRTMVALALTVLAGSTTALFAQAPGFSRTMVTKGDIADPSREAVIARVEIIPGGVVGWHTHPGEEISYITDGQATLMIAGQAPRKVSAGEGFVIPAGVVHNARNEGASAVKLVGVYVVEKCKPLASPATEPK